MRLIDSVATIGPAMPNSLKNRVSFRTTCVLYENEIIAFNDALQALAVAIESDDQIFAEDSVTVILCDRDSVAFDFDDPEILGNHINLIFCFLHRWRIRSLNILQMTTCMLEEFCHHFWAIRDEIRVKYKVLEVIQHIHPSVQLSDVYSPNWLEGDLR